MTRFIVSLLLGFPTTARANDVAAILSLKDQYVQFTAELVKRGSTPLDARDAAVKRALDAKEQALSPEQRELNRLARERETHRLVYAGMAFQEWLKLVADLDAESHNNLIFSLLEDYHRGDAAPADRVAIEAILGQIDKILEPQLSEIESRRDSARLIGDTALNGLIIYTSGKLLEYVCRSTGCVDKAKGIWNYWLERRIGAATRTPLPHSQRLSYRRQPPPKVAGYLEFKKSATATLLERARHWRPRSVSSQLVLAGLAGLTWAAGDMAAAHHLEQKVPPKAMLRLSQVHRACDLSLALAEIASRCQGDSCKPEQKAEIMRLVGESAILATSYPSLENLDVAALRKDQSALLSSVPAQHQKLFASLFDVDSDRRAPLCQRLALNNLAIGQIVN